MVSPKVRHDSSIGNGSLIKLPGKSSSTKVPFHYLSPRISQIPWSDVVNLMQKATAYPYLLTALPGEWQFPLRFALANSRKSHLTLRVRHVINCRPIYHVVSLIVFIILPMPNEHRISQKAVTGRPQARGAEGHSYALESERGVGEAKGKNRLKGTWMLSLEKD